MSSSARILLFREDEASETNSLGLRLAGEGFDISFVRSFLEAVPFFAPGRTDLFLFYLPKQDWVRNAILTEARRANPELQIIAMAADASQDLLQFLGRFRVASVLPMRGNWRDVLNHIRETLASSAPAEGIVDTTALRPWPGGL